MRGKGSWFRFAAGLCPPCFEHATSPEALRSAMIDPLFPLTLLVTGDPVPNVERSRGSFAALIRAALGEGIPAQVRVLDARRGELPSRNETHALVITGSPESVASRAPWILEAEARV